MTRVLLPPDGGNIHRMHGKKTTTTPEAQRIETSWDCEKKIKQVEFTKRSLSLELPTATTGIKFKPGWVFYIYLSFNNILITVFTESWQIYQSRCQGRKCRGNDDISVSSMNCSLLMYDVCNWYILYWYKHFCHRMINLPDNFLINNHITILHGML